MSDRPKFNPSEEWLRKMAAAEDGAGCINIGSADEVMQRLAEDSRTCTCHPSEAPVPCQQRYALTECKLAAAEATVAQQAATINHVTEFLEAIVIAFKEPDGGPYFKLRAFAEKNDIYADDLGRDRVMLRIAQAALARVKS